MWVTRRTVLVSGSVAVMLALGVWGFLGGRKEAAREKERERPVKPPRHVTVENGAVVVTLDAATEQRSGLELAPLAAGHAREDVRGYATVVDLKTLAPTRNDYVAAAAQAEKARATVEASRREYERLRLLHADAQNVSTKALEAAQATYRSEQAGAEAASAEAQTLAAAARQEWGDVLGRWMIEGSPAFTRLLNREDVLVQITLPPEISMNTLPERAFVLAGQSRVPVRLVSVAARTDPKIQGLSGFYVAPGSAHLIPGMSLPAALTAGPEVAGVVVPASAVVYTEGRAWIYVQDAPHAFVRRAIQTDMAVTGDSYLARSVPPGTKVVVRGAQQLLSDEYRAQIQVGEDGG